LTFHSTIVRPCTGTYLTLPLYYFRLFQEQNRDVLKKLGFATLLMFTLPIIGFYLGLHFLFSQKQEPTAWSGIFAVVIANCVVSGYVYSAFAEDDEGDMINNEDDEDNDEAAPRVGAFKRRTD